MLNGSNLDSSRGSQNMSIRHDKIPFDSEISECRESRNVSASYDYRLSKIQEANESKEKSGHSTEL
jgi:hypothetical protein